MLGFQKPTQESLSRLITNANMLLESAYTAYLAKRVSKSSCSVKIFLGQICKLIKTISNKTIKLKSLFDLSWPTLDTTSVLNKTFDDIDVLAKKSGYKIPTTRLRYWTFYWLKQHQSLFLPRQRSVKVMGYTLGKAKVSHIKVQLLENTENVELVEDPETCLLPFGKAYVDGIERAWRKRGNVNCCWTLQTERDAGEDGDSLSAAVATAFASLVQDSCLAEDRVVLGVINDKDDSLVPVGFEEAKLKAAAKQGVKLAALVKRKFIGESLGEHNSSSRLSEHVIAELKAQNLNVFFIDNLEEAIELVTIRECPLYNVPALTEQFISRKEVVSEIKATLLSNQTVELTGSQKVGLQGMGGIGKTWLARELANLRDPEIWKAFPQGIVWTAIGYTADENYLRLRQEEIIEALTGERPLIGDLLQGTNKLRKALEDKACLLILDDIWTKKQFEVFNVLSKKSKLLITSRNAQLLSGTNATTHSIERLSPPDAMKMLTKYAGEEGIENLPEAQTIATKWCRCLPFGLGLCGSLVKVSKWTWKGLLDKLEKVDIKRLRNDHFDSIDEIIASNSIKALEGDAEYYQELAAFRQDSKITISAISILNYSYGLEECEIRPIVEKFIDYGLLLKMGEDVYELHDLLYACLVNRSNQHKKPLNEFRKELSDKLLIAYKTKYGEWYKATEDTYFVENAVYHFKQAGRDDEFKQLLVDFNYMQAKLNSSDVNALLADYYLEDREIELIKKTLVLSTYALKKDPLKKQSKEQITGQLATQLTARLTKKELKSEVIKKLLEQINQLNKCIWFQPLTNCLTSPDCFLIATLEAHFSGINALGAIESGKNVISGSDDGTLKVWDIERQECIATLNGHSDKIKALVVVGDGKNVVSASLDNTLKVWDIEKQKCIMTLKMYAPVTTLMAMKDSKKVISGSVDGTLKVWDIENQKCVATLRGHSNAIAAIEIIEDDRKIVSGSWDNTLKIWDIENQTCLATLKGHFSSVCSLKIMKNSKQIISGSVDKTLKIWDIENQKCITTLRGHSNAIAAIEIIEDDRKIVSGSWDNTLKIWDIENQTCLMTLEGHFDRVTAIKIMQENRRVISSSADGTLKVWGIDDQKYVVGSRRNGYAIAAIKAIENSKKVIIMSEDNKYTVWDPYTQKCFELSAVSPIRGKITSVKVTGEGKIIVYYVEDKLIVLEIENRKCLAILGYISGGELIEVTEDGKIIVCSFKDKLIVLEVQTEKCLMFISERISAIGIIQDSRKIILGDYAGNIKIWDVENQTCIAFLTGHFRGVTSVKAIEKGKRVVSGSLDGTVKMWDVESRTCIASLGSYSQVTAVEITDEGKKVSIFFVDGTVKIWDIENQICFESFRLHVSNINRLRITEINRFDILHDNKKLNLWDIENHKEIACFYGEVPFTKHLFIDSRLIVAGDSNGQVYFFRLRGLNID